MSELAIHFEPLTPKRWPDLEKLFGSKGAAGGCWCMWWRFTPATYKENAGQGNRAALQNRVNERRATGLLTYVGDDPVGWISVSPREEYERIPTSQTWRPIDDVAVWSIVCFFIRKDQRRRGLTDHLIHAAVEYAKAHGAQVIEAYPKDVVAVGNKAIADGDLYWGALSTFQRAGFVEVERRNKVFPIVRLTL